MTAALVAFAAVLRRIGIAVSMVEMVDASRATALVDLGDRARLRRALALTMVKRAEQFLLFDAAFDLCFPPLGPARPATEETTDGPFGTAGPYSPEDPAELLEDLVAALRAGSGASVGELAGQLVEVFGALEPTQAGRGERHYTQRILRQLDLSALLHRAMRLDGNEALSPFERQLATIERATRLEVLRSAIAADVRRRLLEGDGLDQAVDELRKSTLDIDFLKAGAAELEQMRRLVQPLARRLAARARRWRRRASRGRLDIRRTVRLSLGYGGVAMDPAWRHRHAKRAELVVLCDVSGSVAEFAKFTLSLLQALHLELPRTRSFVFVDAPEEVSDLVRTSPEVIDPRLFLSRPGAVRDDGHSDYGAVLARLLEEQGSCLGPRTTVVICGDARTNYRPGRPELLRALKARVRHVYWLNPEPRQAWGTTDSVLPSYAPHCDEVAEVRTLRQLGHWVEHALTD